MIKKEIVTIKPTHFEGTTLAEAIREAFSNAITRIVNDMCMNLVIDKLEKKLLIEDLKEYFEQCSREKKQKDRSSPVTAYAFPPIPLYLVPF